MILIKGVPPSTLALPKLWRFTVTSKDRWILNDHPDVLDDLIHPTESRPSAVSYYDFAEKEWLTTPVTDTIPLHGLRRALIRPKDLEDHECADIKNLIGWLTVNPNDPGIPIVDGHSEKPVIANPSLPTGRVQGKSKARSPEPLHRPVKRRKTDSNYTVHLESSSDDFGGATEPEEMVTAESEGLSWWMRITVRDGILGLERIDRIRKVFGKQEWVEATWKRQRSDLMSLTKEERTEWLLEKGDLLWLALHKYVIKKRKREEQEKKDARRKEKGDVKIKLEPVECITISDDDEKNPPSKVESSLPPPPPKSEPSSPEHPLKVEPQIPPRKMTITPKKMPFVNLLSPSSNTAPTSSPAKFMDYFEAHSPQDTSQDHPTSWLNMRTNLKTQILETGNCCFCNEPLPSSPSLELKDLLSDALVFSTELQSPKPHPFARKYDTYGEAEEEEENEFCALHRLEIELQQKVERRKELEVQGLACPINQCFDPSPSNPSPHLRRDIESYKSTFKPYDAFELQMQICRRHRGEANFKQAVESGWPVIVNLTQLEDRLDSHRPALATFLANPSGRFWEQFCIDERQGVFNGPWEGLFLKADEYPVG
jgi:hypothetical protein